MQQLVNLGYTDCPLCHSCNFSEGLIFLEVKRDRNGKLPQATVPVAFTLFYFPNIQLMPRGPESCNSESSDIPNSKLVCLYRYTSKKHMKLKGQV